MDDGFTTEKGFIDEGVLTPVKQHLYISCYTYFFDKAETLCMIFKKTEGCCE